MSYVLVAVTQGDELFPSTRTVVAASPDYSALEIERSRRAREREEWLAANANAVPWWQECSLIHEEAIEEVLDVFQLSEEALKTP